MLEDHDYMRRPKRIQKRSVTVALLVLNVAAFVLQKTLLPRLISPYYFALSLPGLFDGYLWQLLTYQFMHGGYLHLLLNCWGLYLFGRDVEWELGKTRFLVLYLTSGVVGGLFQMLVSFLWPHYFGGGGVGASAGLFGVVAAYALLFPDRQLVVLPVPLPLEARLLIWFSLVLAALGIALPKSFGDNIAHAAHLGGMLTGLAFIHRRAARDPFDPFAG